MPGPYPLSTLAPTIDRNGINVVSFIDILASLQAHYRAVFGSDIYIEADSQDGQWLAVQAQAIYDLGQAIATAYFAYSPSFATGVGLASQVKINGLRRLQPTQSNAEVILTGQAGTIITGGVVQDDFNNLWDLPSPITIPASGQIPVIAIARNPGQTLADPGSITKIATQIVGWQSVTNVEAAQPGNAIESDARLRLRQHRSTALPAITPIAGIYATLANIQDVGRVEIYENDTDVTNELGIPAHSIACVLDSGNATEIANAIALKKSPGCGTYGTTSVDVEDGAAMPNTINFFYVEHVQVYVEVTITRRTGWVVSTADLIKQSVALMLNEQRIGFPVYRGWLEAPASLAGDIATEATDLSQFALHRLAETYVITQIRIGLSLDTMGTDDITLHFAQAASITIDDVTILYSEGGVAPPPPPPSIGDWDNRQSSWDNANSLWDR